jgi:hypothetical protein
MGLPIRDVTQMQLPEMRIEAPRPALPQLANVLARETRPELEGTRSVPTSPTERYSLGGVLADIAAQPIAALSATSGRIGEGVQRTLGFEDAARRTRERTQALGEALAPSTGPGVAARLPLELATSAAPYLAAGPGTAGMLRSAALTGIESRAEEGSTVKALSELTGYKPLQRLAESPFKTAADIALDVGFNVAPEAIGGALRGTRTAARAAEPGFLPAAGAVTRQIGQNIAAAPAAALQMAREVPGAIRRDPTSALVAAATLGGEAVGPGLGTLAATLPAALRTGGTLGDVINAVPQMPRAGAMIPQEVRSVGRFGFVRLPETYQMNEALEREHVVNVLALTEPTLSTIGARTEETVNGAGLFGGDVSPNGILRFAADAADDDMRAAAAARGIAFGQDQQLWYRPARPTDPDRTSAFVITGKDFAELPDEAIAAVVSRLQADDALGPYGGATRDGNHLLALNLKRYTGMDDATFQAAVSRALADVGDAYDIDIHPTNYYAEHLDGTADYARTLAGRPDALRAARAALVDAQPEYLRYTQAVGGDVAATEREIADRIGSLDRLLRQVEQPPPLGRTRDAVPVAEAAKTVLKRFPRLLAKRDEVLVPEMVKRMEALVDDLVTQGVIPREMAQDWYRGATLDQRQIARLALPELREDRKYTLYTVVNSILSSGQQVPVESRQGLNVFDQYLRSGRFSILNPDEVQYRQALTGGKKGFTGERGTGVLGEAMAASPRTINHEQALARLDALVQALGEDGAVEALVGTVPIMGARGVVKEERPALVYLFGPKIGQYAMDKLGIPGGGKSTIDLWMARLDYALRGDASAIRGNKLNDTVLPSMRRRMQSVLAEFAARHNMPESGAQALAWYAIKNAFRNAGAKEKRLAYATLGSGTTEALLSPIGRELGAEPLAQGLMRPGAYERAVEGWDDPKLREFARRTGRQGTIAPTAGAFAGKVFDVTGVVPEALRFVARPAVAPAVGAVVGAGAAEEDRFGGAMAGAAVGAGVAGAVGGIRALAAARQQLRAAGLPETLANAYAYAKRGIDFTGAGERTLGRRLRGDWRSIVQRGVDNYADAQRALDRLAGRAEAAGLAPEASVGTALNEALSSDVTAARALRHGLGVERGGLIDPLTKEVIGEPLEDVFKPLGGNPAKNEQALTYAVALRNIGRYDKAVAAGDANPLRVYGGDMARMEADRAIVDGFGQKPEFVEFANRLEQYFANLTEYAVRSGLWTPEVARAIRESDTFYVPFKRLIEAHTGMGAGPMRGGATPGRVSPGVQRFRGSDLMIGNPAVTIAEYTQALIRRADMYRVGNALIESVNALGEAGQPLLTKINASDPMARALGVAEAEGAYRALGLGEEEARQMGDLFMRLNKDNPVIYRNTPTGKEYYLVNDPALWDAVQSINPQDPEALNALVTVFGPLKRYATLFATGMSPQFWFGTNIPRDILTAAAQNPNITMTDVGVGFLEGLKSIVGRSQMVEQLSRGGMGQVSQFGGDVDVRSLARQIAPTTIGEAAGAAVGQGVTLPLRALERVGRGTELPMRVAAARAAQRRAAEAGVSEAGQRAVATRAGAAATVDFRRRAGTAFQRFLERTVPYFGAAKKGGVWFARAARNNPKTVGAAAGVITLGTVWEYLLSDDKDRAEFVDRPAGERARYLHLGETRVALPQEYAVLASAVRMGLAQVKQDDPFVYDQFKAAMLNMLPPIYSDVAKGDPIALMPFPVGRELIELSRNREEFTGRPIVTPGMERQLPAARRRETTAPTFDVMAAAARRMGIEEASPVQAEFLTRGMFGRFTPAVTAVTDIAARPIAGREAQPQVPLPFARQPLNPITGFQSRPVTRGQSEQEFYNLRNEVQQAQATYNALKRDRAEARQRGDTATVNRTTAEAERLAATNPVFKAVFEDRNTKRISGFLKTADDKLEKLQAKREQAVSAFANGRITGARARQVIDSLDAERAKLFREGYTRLTRRVPR